MCREKKGSVGEQAQPSTSLESTSSLDVHEFAFAADRATHYL